MRELRCYVNGYVITELHRTPFNKYEEKINPLSFTVREGQGLYSTPDLTVSQLTSVLLLRAS